MVEIEPRTLTPASGEPIGLRTLHREDVVRFAAFLTGLSGETRSKFRPHDFTFEVAQRICDGLEDEDTVRLVVVTKAEIIGYFLLHPLLTAEDRQRYASHGIGLTDGGDCQFAPALADAYQNSGLASMLMPSCIEIAKELGYRRLILLGGVYVSNEQAIRFYEKQGFQKVGTFDPGENREHRFDMMLTLGSQA